MFSAGGGIRGLRLRLVPVHVPLNRRKVVVHLIHAQQGHLGSDTKTPKVNTPGCGGRKGDEELWTWPHLEITINQPVGFKVVVVFSKWIYQLFGHLSKRTKQRRVRVTAPKPTQQLPVHVTSITFSQPT